MPAGTSQTLSKPVDIGFNGFSVSADAQGTILQIGVFHPKHGIVVAEPYQQFDGTKFRDPAYVRDHRSRMLKSIQSESPGFGVRLQGHIQQLKVEHLELGSARFLHSTSDGLRIETVLQVNEHGEIMQSIEITSEVDITKAVDYVMNLGISINRASYGQLTEGGPIPIPRSENDVRLIDNGQIVLVANHNLGAHLQCSIREGAEHIDLSHAIKERVFIDSIVTGSLSRQLKIPPKSVAQVVAQFRLTPGTVPEPLRSLDAACSAKFKKSPEPKAIGRYIIRRNVEYIIGNCAVAHSSSRSVVCLLTDHVALPLGWMRDNYWQIQLLLDALRNLNELVEPQLISTYSGKIKETVMGHLNWVFRYAQRPHQYWHRSYLTTGRPKDGPVFQLDQQCYPFLELCEVWEVLPESHDLVSSILKEDVISKVLALIESKRDSSTGLFSTEETPGDDAVEFPFHFSSHVLLWHAFSRLALLTSNFTGYSDLSKRLRTLAIQIQTATLRHFLYLDTNTHLSSFAYLVDGHGTQTFYHDANDIPTLFASQWGFVSSAVEKQAWRNTMDFAFSEANLGGYYGEGRFGGLGSVHTRGPWPLGYFQQWRYSQLTGNTQAEARLWEKLCATMFWDGTFCEAVDVETGGCTSKAWFSWPGAMIGSGLLQPGVKEHYI